MALQLRGEDVVTAIRGWIAGEIEKAPSFAHDMGKYYFTTSTATIGAIAALSKLGSQVGVISIHLGLALAILFAAAITGVLLSIPVPRSLTGDMDLFTEYAKTIHRIIFYSVLWLVLWVVGSVYGLVAVLQ